MLQENMYTQQHFSVKGMLYSRFSLDTVTSPESRRSGAVMKKDDPHPEKRSEDVPN